MTRRRINLGGSCQHTSCLPRLAWSFDIGWWLCYLIAMKVEWDGKEYELEKLLTVGQLLEKFSLNPEAHIVVANEKLVTEDCKLSHEDTVRIIRVISGG